jgi:hypothetical protein
MKFSVLSFTCIILIINISLSTTKVNAHFAKCGTAGNCVVKLCNLRTESYICEDDMSVEIRVPSHLLIKHLKSLPKETFTDAVFKTSASKLINDDVRIDKVMGSTREEYMNELGINPMNLDIIKLTSSKIPAFDTVNKKSAGGFLITARNWLQNKGNEKIIREQFSPVADLTLKCVITGRSAVIIYHFLFNSDGVNTVNQLNSISPICLNSYNDPLPNQMIGTSNCPSCVWKKIIATPILTEATINKLNRFYNSDKMKAPKRLKTK